MRNEMIRNQGCVVEWNNGTFTLFNGQSQHIQTMHYKPDLTGTTCVPIPKLKFSRKRKPVNVYYVPGECKQEVLVNNFVGVDYGDIEEFPTEEQQTEGDVIQIDEQALVV